MKWLKALIPYRREYEALEKRFDIAAKRQRELKKELSRLEYQRIQGLEHQLITFLERLLNDPSVIVLELNRQDESATVLAMKFEGMIANESVFEFQIYEIRPNAGINNEGYIRSGISENRLEISEISVPKGRGWGSLLIGKVIEYAKIKRCETVLARLSTVDLEDKQDPEHRSRLIHFYEKHGFVLSPPGAKGGMRAVLKLEPMQV